MKLFGTVQFAFDGVSKDKTVGLLVSASLTVKSGGERKLHADACVLLNAPFQRRLMAFINKDVKDNFLNRCDGLLQLGRIEMLVCDKLPSSMQEEIKRFQAVAKAEVGDIGRNPKLRGKRK